jgi:hypothetical protein
MICNFHKNIMTAKINAKCKKTVFELKRLFRGNEVNGEWAMVNGEWSMR